MNKLDILKAVYDFAPEGITMDDFYSINLWKTNEVNLQGKYESRIVVALKSIGVECSVKGNGYIEASAEIDLSVGGEEEKIRINITLT